MSAWTQTLSTTLADEPVGEVFDFRDPKPEMIDFHRSAVVLSVMPRFNGQTRFGPLPVAQHEVEGARAILRDTGRADAAAAFLVHDHHEDVFGDLTTPAAEGLEYHAVAAIGHARFDAARVIKEAIKAQKRAIDRAVHVAACLPWPLPPDVERIVKEYDLRMCRTERDARMHAPPKPWDDVIENAEPVVGCDLTPWTAEHAERHLMVMSRALLPRFGGPYPAEIFLLEPNTAVNVVRARRPMGLRYDVDSKQIVGQ